MRSPIRALFAVVSALALGASAADKPNPYLAQAAVFYQGGEYKQCVDRLKSASKWRNSREESAKIALYKGLCLANLRKADEAEVEFRTALAISPGLELPPFTSPKVIELFKKVAESLAPAAPPAKEPLPPIAEAPPPKSEPVVPKVESVPPPSDAPVATRLVPAPPPAPPLTSAPSSPSLGGPLALAGAGVVALGVGVALGELALLADTSARSAAFQSDALAQRHNAEGYATAANVAYGVSGAVALAAAIVFIASR